MPQNYTDVTMLFVVILQPENDEGISKQRQHLTQLGPQHATGARYYAERGWITWGAHTDG